MAAAITAIGGIVSAIGAMKQAKASAKAEKLRERQMRLEAMRKKRELIREGQVARAEALSNATAQGAASSTGLFGGYGQRHLRIDAGFAAKRGTGNLIRIAQRGAYQQFLFFLSIMVVSPPHRIVFGYARVITIRAQANQQSFELLLSFPAALSFQRITQCVVKQ